MANLYALLVGINEYDDPSKNLNGCLNDVESFENYLKEAIQSEKERKIVLLTNDQAKKENIIQNIRDHLGQAKADDTILFYFSGHGCQEDAHEALKPFIGDKIEALVCHNSILTSTALADVEIRYLFREIYDKTKARIILITDSCNSGGVTRDVSEARKRLGPFARARTWDKFIFAQPDDGQTAISESDVSNAAKLNDAIPQGSHIHLAACESTESAFEISGHGIFTSNMVKVLKNSKGTITFSDLHSRLRFLVRRRFDQNPQIYAYEIDQKSKGKETGHDLMSTEFLSGAVSTGGARCNVHYNGNAWILEKGEIHGMPPTAQAKKLMEEKKLEINIVDKDSGEILTIAEINEVKPGFTSFSPGGVMDLDADQTLQYKAEIKGLYLDALDIFIAGKEEGASALTSYVEDQANHELISAANLNFVPDRTQAEYQVIAFQKTDGAKQSGYMITSPRDPVETGGARALCQNISDWDVKSHRKLIDYLGKIAHWYFVRNLHNRNPNPDMNDLLTWKIFYEPCIGKRTQNGLEQLSSTGEKSFDASKDEDGRMITDQLTHVTKEIKLEKPGTDQISYLKLKLEMHNPSNTKLYISLLYLGQRFEVMSQIVTDESRVIDMPTGKTARAFNKSIFTLDDFIRTENWEDQTLFFKLMISTEPYELGNSLDQGPLPPPGEISSHRGFESAMAASPQISGWTTRMLELRVSNPYYEQKG